METFEYKHGETTEDDKIEHILKILTEYSGQPNIHIGTLCHIIGQPFDNTEMIGKVSDKMLKYGLAKIDMDNDAIMKITPKGREVYHNGGFAKFLETQQEIETKDKTNKDYKGQLEILKLELETDKLKYEKTLRKQKEEIDTLNKVNLRLKIGTAIFAFISFVFGLLINNLFNLYDILKAILKK
jgi:hypothetical protein